MTAQIPYAKVVKALRLLEAFDVTLGLSQILIEEKVVEQTMGLLQWMSEVLVSGRFHLAQLVSAKRAAARLGYCVVTVGLRNECSWWRQVLLRWNRVAMILPPIYAISPWKWADSPVTDASRELSTLSGGGGAFYNGMCAVCVWTPKEVTELDIFELEALMCVLWVATLIEMDPHLLRGRRFTFRNDNMPWRDSHNASRSNKPAIAVLLGWLHEYTRCRHCTHLLCRLIGLSPKLTLLQMLLAASSGNAFTQKPPLTITPFPRCVVCR
jgi:hypothetical protein